MTGGITGALRAYGATAAGTPGQGLSASGVSFADALGEAAQRLEQTTREADAATQGALRGEVGTTDVVLAVSRAEDAVQLAVAVRDRVISAYQDVMRMNI
ncbi:MAG: flagellar hook-basal body complex protein FliE [Acetobacteraceae bacterium]|nr:flagellar hook-basal body complex protein FliE [Acetobacteraceae bacterium]